MADEPWIEELRARMREFEKNPGNIIEKLIEAGIIDNRGRVLVRVPEPPLQPRKPRKRKKPPQSANGQDEPA